MHSFHRRHKSTTFPRINRGPLQILQVNLGYLCNLSCVHCHVNAGPKRTEIMDRDTTEQVIDFILKEKVSIVDLTGGAPEMNPQFRNLVGALRNNNVHVIDRCNLTILNQDGFVDMADFLAENRVEIVASLPCYIEENVDRQRGKGVFGCSLKILKRLNRLGYGQPGSGLLLNLVYNPQGPVLPPPQEQLQLDYKRKLETEFGIAFNKLYTMTNMPIQRFARTLRKTGAFESYMDLLRASFSEQNLDSVMCRSTLSIDWQGYVYDCDFNQMLNLPTGLPGRSKVHISELATFRLEGKPIQVGDHCFGCTAGQGSSCGGALDESASD